MIDKIHECELYLAGNHNVGWITNECGRTTNIRCHNLQISKMEMGLAPVHQR